MAVNNAIICSMSVLRKSTEIMGVAATTGALMAGCSTAAEQAAPTGPATIQVSRAAACAGEQAVRFMSPKAGTTVTGYAGFTATLRVCKLEADQTIWVLDNAPAPAWSIDSVEPAGLQVIGSLGLHDVDMHLGFTDVDNTYKIEAFAANPACNTALTNAANGFSSTIGAIPPGCIEVASVTVSTDNMV
jgi:hypothetical protein